MPRIIRSLAVTGAAAAALLGAGGSLSDAAAADDNAGVVRVAAQEVARATGAPVTLPSGKTIHVTGLGSAAYRADAAQQATVTTLADAAPGAGSGTGGGTGSMESELNQNQQQGGQQPTGQYGTGTNGIRTQASGGSISMTAAIGLGLLIAVIAAIRSNKVRWLWAVVCIALGVYLTPTVVGPMIQSFGGSIGSSLGNVWSGL
ncbi:hypothetical protein ACFU99_34945 [Streptomyces sp. NPDC057654]|uniref:hypothetical protein n=1 Tax=Streptomyces sp. NPDC057654 TaxID=3346196 RepID=UPI0036780E55